MTRLLVRNDPYGFYLLTPDEAQWEDKNQKSVGAGRHHYETVMDARKAMKVAKRIGIVTVSTLEEGGIIVMDEQPTCCPDCGRRVEFMQLKPTKRDGERHLNICDTAAGGCGRVFLTCEKG